VADSAFNALGMFAVSKDNSADSGDFSFTCLLAVKDQIAEPAYGDGGHGKKD
jgi:hypothetical protein